MRAAAAPSKSNSLSKRAQASSGAVRSLVPLFSSFTPAAIRASQLGARYMTLRPGARAIASMQGRMAGSPASGLPTAGSSTNASPADSATTAAGATPATATPAGRKRARPKDTPQSWATHSARRALNVDATASGRPAMQERQAPAQQAVQPQPQLVARMRSAASVRFYR
eukprot:scaffold3.g6766.t1